MSELRKQIARVGARRTAYKEESPIIDVTARTVKDPYFPTDAENLRPRT
jgi:hypothetical protein